MRDRMKAVCSVSYWLCMFARVTPVESPGIYRVQIQLSDFPVFTQMIFIAFRYYGLHSLPEHPKNHEKVS